MKVEVKLFATMKEFLPGRGDYGATFFEFDEGATVATLLDRLKIPIDMPKIVLINGQASKPERELRDGDVVSIFPPLVGG